LLRKKVINRLKNSKISLRYYRQITINVCIKFSQSNQASVKRLASKRLSSSQYIFLYILLVGADLLKEKPKDLKKLGIDEITHLKGGKNYAAVLVNLDKRKSIALLEKRNKEVIAEYLLELGCELLNQIEEVCIDLWIPYKSVIKELMPNAQIVADRFHVMKQINQELDSRRKKEKRQIEKLKNKKERAEKLDRILFWV
jgi:transposase